ncbi:MAG: 16S rRNA (guanine(527)-N(7))-methyltransferase RsmG [Calditrichaeota bacterium]|nr:16S rRNA (guanine(527)-N(7))-methyltransferase RsmG [Calditrichota bacterium]
MFHVEHTPPPDWLSDQLRDLWAGVERLGFHTSEEQRIRFVKYLSLLWSENQKMNLFSRKDIHRLANRHILESIGWVHVVAVRPKGRWVDIGSGAGFPGIPLKIMFPEMSLVLVESIAKKAFFLERVIRELTLSDTIVVRERAEILSRQPEYRGKFLFGTARAVSSLEKLIKWTHPFFAPGGHLFLIKGGDLSDELQAAKKMIQNQKIRLKIYDYLIDFITNAQSAPERKLIDVEFLN